MTSSSQQRGWCGPVRAPEVGGQRPLPAGVVGLSPIERAQRPERHEAAPGGTLIVGQGIRVKGEIKSCETLVVEGRVEASLNATALEVLKDGLFTGTAEVETAQIAGAVEGTLRVRTQLTIKASGRVSGTICYARITIEGGGQISGDVTLDTGSEARAKDNVA